MLPNTLYEHLCQQSDLFNCHLSTGSLSLFRDLSRPFLSSQSKGAIKDTCYGFNKGWMNEWKAQQQSSRKYVGTQGNLSGGLEHGGVMMAVEGSE